MRFVDGSLSVDVDENVRMSYAVLEWQQAAYDRLSSERFRVCQSINVSEVMGYYEGALCDYLARQCSSTFDGSSIFLDSSVQILPRSFIISRLVSGFKSLT